MIWIDGQSVVGRYKMVIRKLILFTSVVVVTNCVGKISERG